MTSMTFLTGFSTNPKRFDGLVLAVLIHFESLTNSWAFWNIIAVQMCNRLHTTDS